MIKETNKASVFKTIEEDIKGKGFDIVNQDQTRPWGGFFVINEDQAQQFADTYFEGIRIEELRISGKLSPKILVVAPDKRLS